LTLYFVEAGKIFHILHIFIIFIHIFIIILEITTINLIVNLTFMKLTIERNLGLTCMDPEGILVGVACMIGHAGSILCTRTSNENNFFGGNTSFHVCRSFHMLALVFSSTY